MQKRDVILTEAIINKILGKDDPAEIKRIIESIHGRDYSEYSDLQEYRMANDGDFPSGDYCETDHGSVYCEIQYRIADSDAEKFAKCAMDSNTVDEFLEKLYKIPFYRMEKHFQNCHRIRKEQVSPEYVAKRLGGKIEMKTNIRLNRPRYFRATLMGLLRKNDFRDDFLICQPNRKKAEFIVLNQYWMKDVKNGQLFKFGLRGPIGYVIIKGDVAVSTG